MPKIYFSKEQLEQVRDACLKYSFLGHKFDDKWTDQNQYDLRDSILLKLGLTGDDSNWCGWHSDGCKCHGCTQVRKERKELKKLKLTSN